MHLRRFVRVLLAVAALSLVAAGCGDDEDEPEASASGSTEASDEGGAPADLDLVSGGKLTVCSDIPYEPFEFEGPDGEYTGYDIDLVRAIAEDADLELDVRVTPFDGILGALEAGDCDVVASSVTITDERAEQVDFSEPYFDADQSLLVKKDQAEELATLDDLAGKTIGVQSGTTGETYANENKPEGATIQSFEGADGLFAAIEAGNIDAILQDFPVNAYRATKDDSLTVTETFATGEQYGFAVKKGNESVLSLLDDGLATMREDGRFDEIFATYFGDAESEE